MSRRDGRGPLRLKKPHARSNSLFFFTSSSIPKLEAVECHLVLWVIVLATFDGHLGSFGEDTTSGLQTQQVRTGTVERERNFPKLLSPPLPPGPRHCPFPSRLSEGEYLSHLKEGESYRNFLFVTGFFRLA